MLQLVNATANYSPRESIHERNATQFKMAGDSTTTKDITEFLTLYANDIKKQDNGLLMLTVLIFGAIAIVGGAMVARYYIRKERRDQEQRDKQFERDREFQNKQLDREQAYRDRQEQRADEERLRIQEQRVNARADLAAIVTTEIGKLAKDSDEEFKQLRNELQGYRDKINTNGFSIAGLAKDIESIKHEISELKQRLALLEQNINK
mgnify:CR=1 FL=1